MRQILNDFQTLCHERVLLLQMHELKQGLEKKVLKSISNIPMQGGCQTVEKKTLHGSSHPLYFSSTHALKSPL